MWRWPEKKQFSLGSLTEGTIELNFSEGDQLVIVPEDELYVRVVIFLNAETFIPENIAQGVIVAELKERLMLKRYAKY